MASILAMENHKDVADDQELLDLLRQFLLAQGWTIVRHEENSAWGNVPPWGFVSGDQNFLEVYSNGYGNQDLHFRFLSHGSLAYGRTFEGNLGFGDTSLNTSNSFHPVYYFKNPVDSVWHLRPFSNNPNYDAIDCFISNEIMPNVWFFGYQQKYCCVVIQLDDQKVHYFHFGTHKMEDETQDFGAFCCGREITDWRTQVVDTSFDQEYWRTFSEYINKNGRSGASGNLQNTCMNEGGGQAHAEILQSYNFNCFPSVFSVKNLDFGLRPIVSSYQYARDPRDGLWFYYGKTFYYRLSVVDYRIGEIFYIGNEKYISFPNFQVDLSRVGVCFRIE